MYKGKWSGAIFMLKVNFEKGSIFSHYHVHK